jgi:hypothetical protein
MTITEAAGGVFHGGEWQQHQVCTHERAILTRRSWSLMELAAVSIIINEKSVEKWGVKTTAQLYLFNKGCCGTSLPNDLEHGLTLEDV